MNTFPGSPKLLKGAVVSIDPLNPLASVVVFQYNPATLSRTLEAQTAGGEGGEPLRFKGAPTETIKIEVEIDAADQLEKAEGTATEMGIFPQLSALEMLVYPKSALVIANTALLMAGTIEIIPPSAPLTLFIWGPRRVLPVRVTEFGITEDTHDPALNPLRAKVSLGLRVLSYSDLSVGNPARGLFLAHQIVKETMAVIGSVGNLDAVAGGNVKLL